MKKILLVLSLVIFCLPSRAQKDNFLDLKFGMFIHYNMATYQGVQWVEGYPSPSEFDPGVETINTDAWADAAVAAGMKYAVLTVKHVGGFCLWDSKYTTYDVMHPDCPYQKDLVAQFIESFTSRGLKVGLYYCWRHPGFDANKKNKEFKVLPPECDPATHTMQEQIEFQKAQIAELITKYPDVFYIWNDALDTDIMEADEASKFFKNINPDILVSGNWWDWSKKGTQYADIAVTEMRHFPAENQLRGETCWQLEQKWFWNGDSKSKDPERIVEQLTKVNNRNANFLLNVGPDQQGNIPESSIKTLEEVGKRWDPQQGIYPGANEKTPSLSQYFSWINNTNEGSTEAQTLANLDFFKYLHDEYGMILDIYVVSAGAIDKARWYGSMDSEEFKTQFPNGFDPIYKKAKEMGTRLGTWGGPDGFGDTPEEEQARNDMIVSLFRDYEFRLLKLDAVVGQLRDEKQDAFMRMMNESRKHSPELIFLNHRLNLSEEAKQHATTFLWGGAETYIDVHMGNWKMNAPHHRGGAISRNVVPDLMRLTEDHGVCISSCIDYWEDDLILQAFNRTLILSPQIYGNPWFLRDDEYPKLARIFNIARQYGEIMVEGMVLPEEKYGEKAVSRGDSRTRLVTLRNLSWEQTEVNIKIGEEIGLSENIKYEVRLLHPVERILGKFNKGASVKVEVDPYRAALVLICPEDEGGIGITGCDYEIIQDVPGKPVRIMLNGLPGTIHTIKLDKGGRAFSSVELEGEKIKSLNQGRSLKIEFPGDPLNDLYHRKIADLVSCDVPEDAEALYEATIFSTDNNALEVRELDRSGETKIPQVKEARDEFLNQKLFADRGLWDYYMFDGDPETSFYVSRRRRTPDLLNGGSLRFDFGKPVSMDELIIEVGSEHALQPWKSEEAAFLEVSADLHEWKEIRFLAKSTMKIKLDPEKPVRYVRFRGTPDKIIEVMGFLNGKALDRSEWRGSQLFSPYSRIKAEAAWSASTIINEIPDGAYLAVCLDGEHGQEGAYAAIRVDGKPVGASDRSHSYPVNPWEYPAIKANSHYTYYIPLTEDMEGKDIDIVVLGMKGGVKKFKPYAYLTCYPKPYKKMELVLHND